MDKRIVKLSELLTGYSCNLQSGNRILIEYDGNAAIPLVRQLIKDAYRLGARPYVNCRNSQIHRELLLGADEEQLTFQSAYELMQMEGMDAFITIRSPENFSELSGVPVEKLQLYDSLMDPVLERRLNHTKWVLLRYPNPALAQMSDMSQETFEDFFFDVCTMDFGKMSCAMDSLIGLMNRTDKVQLKGPGTNLTFSIKGFPAIKCDGKHNIPDGEVFTAPVRDSVNGVISYNVKSQWQGVTHENIRLNIKDGKIIEATSSNTAHLNQTLNCDEGARYFGEFAIGVNPFVMEPINDILFDEKICGSLHFTPGAAYEKADNGNHSSLHWDLVMIQRPEYGGGEIWFDDVLIRKDGLFVIDELKCLNPENLK